MKRIDESQNGVSYFQQAKAGHGFKYVKGRGVSGKHDAVAAAQDFRRQPRFTVDHLHNAVQIRFGDTELPNQFGRQV